MWRLIPRAWHPASAAVFSVCLPAHSCRAGHLDRHRRPDAGQGPGRSVDQSRALRAARRGVVGQGSLGKAFRPWGNPAHHPFERAGTDCAGFPGCIQPPQAAAARIGSEKAVGHQWRWVCAGLGCGGHRAGGRLCRAGDRPGVRQCAGRQQSCRYMGELRRRSPGSGRMGDAGSLAAGLHWRGRRHACRNRHLCRASREFRSREKPTSASAGSGIA